MYLATSRPKHAQHQLVIFSPGRQAGGRAGRQARSHLHHPKPKSKPETNEMGGRRICSKNNVGNLLGIDDIVFLKALRHRKVQIL